MNFEIGNHIARVILPNYGGVVNDLRDFFMQCS